MDEFILGVGDDPERYRRSMHPLYGGLDGQGCRVSNRSMLFERDGRSDGGDAAMESTAAMKIDLIKKSLEERKRINHFQKWFELFPSSRS